MMIRLITILIMVLIAAPTVLPAETAEELQAQLTAIEKQIRDTQRALFTSENVKQLREASSAAHKALNDAIAALPAVQELNAQLDAVRKQMSDLMRRKRDVIENEASLADEKQAEDAARQAYRDAITNAPELQSLNAQRDEIRKQLMELSKQKQE